MARYSGPYAFSLPIRIPDSKRRLKQISHGYSPGFIIEPQRLWCIGAKIELFSPIEMLVFWKVKLLLFLGTFQVDFLWVFSGRIAAQSAVCDVNTSSWPVGKLDGDDYSEPYIVTYHRESTRVVRIVANYGVDNIEVVEAEVAKVTPKQYFVKYECFPNPSGGFKGRGFGQLLLHINETVNSI